MPTITILGGLMLGLAGVALTGVGLRAFRRTNATMAYLTEAEMAGIEPVAVDVPGTEEIDPFVDRLLRPVAAALTGRVRNLYPSSRLDRIHDQILHAGLGSSLRAEEFATLQALLAAVGSVAAIALLFLTHSSFLMRFLLSAMIVIVCVIGPKAWLSRKAEDRTKSIARDLPDMLDLLTISVEAGLGLEAALDSVSAELDSPLGEELARTIQEMSLGLSRHQALENLRTRVEVADLRTFVLVLTQADMLGMPIARVLRTQADEMRDRRRARAREMAAKLPVKILFPLMGFILPPLMIVVLGPAVSGIYGTFSHGTL